MTPRIKGEAEISVCHRCPRMFMEHAVERARLQDLWHPCLVGESASSNACRPAFLPLARHEGRALWDNNTNFVRVTYQ